MPFQRSTSYNQGLSEYGRRSFQAILHSSIPVKTIVSYEYNLFPVICIYINFLTARNSFEEIKWFRFSKSFEAFLYFQKEKRTLFSLPPLAVKPSVTDAKP